MRILTIVAAAVLTFIVVRSVDYILTRPEEVRVYWRAFRLVFISPAAGFLCLPFVRYRKRRRVQP